MFTANFDGIVAALSGLSGFGRGDAQPATPSAGLVPDLPDSDTAGGGRRSAVHSVVRDRWHGVAAFDSKRARVVFFLTDPHGFQTSSEVSLARRGESAFPTGRRLRWYLRRECRRLVSAWRSGRGSREIRVPFGTTAEKRGPCSDHSRMARGEFGYGILREAILAARYEEGRQAGLASDLGDWLPNARSSAFRRRVRGVWLKEHHNDGFVNVSTAFPDLRDIRSVRPDEAFVDPHTGSHARAAVLDRPWLAGLRGCDVAAIGAMAGAGADARRVAEAGTAVLGAAEPWTRPGVACMDRFIGSPAVSKDPVSGAVFRDTSEMRRRSTGQRPSQGGPYQMCPAAFVSLLSALPPSWLPRDFESFEALLSLSIVLHRRIPWADASLLAELLSVSKGDWSRTMPYDGARAFDGDLQNAADAVRAVETGLVLPSLARAGHEDVDEAASLSVATRIVAGRGGLPAVLSASTRWHARPGFLPVLGFSGDGGSRRWRSVARDHAYDGLELVFLTDAVQLRDEGMALRHCVGSYADACASGACGIASVRRLDHGTGRSVPISTVQFGFANGRPHVVQHRGRSNSAPSEDAVRLVCDWMEGALAGRIPFEAPVLRKNVRETVFAEPEAGTPADWRGIVRLRSVSSGSWTDLADEIAGMYREAARFVPVVAEAAA